MNMVESKISKSMGGRVAVGHPVDVATGIQSDSFEDYTLPGRMPLIFGRRYSSGISTDTMGMFGPGWTSPFEMSLGQDIDGYYMLGEDGESRIEFDDSTDIVASGGVIRNLAMFCELRQIDSRFVVTKWDPDRQQVVQFVFPRNEDGRPSWLASKQNPAGHAIDVIRDSLQRITGIKQRREGRGYELTYNAKGRVSEVAVVTQSHRRTVMQYGYDQRGQLSERVDALGHRSAYEYDDHSRMVREINIAGMVYHFRYDAKGRCVENTGLDGYGRVTLRIEEYGELCTSQSHRRAGV